MARADLLIDGDFSAEPPGGAPAPTGSTGNWTYVHGSGTSTGIGGAWTFINGSSAGNSAVYLVDKNTNTAQDWIPNAAASNTNGYVVQLDTISAAGPWTTGNAAQQTVSVTAGQDYHSPFRSIPSTVRPKPRFPPLT